MSMMMPSRAPHLWTHGAVIIAVEQEDEAEVIVELGHWLKSMGSIREHRDQAN
jgi:hypothetical protein